tara:strand:- start:1253 stop:2239 length:987 start_codon:yes stop_codon:yes gene_type:complete
LVDINKTPGIHDIRSAAERIKGIVDRTPLLESERLNDHAGARVFLKCEMFQPVGSFKLRGAWNMISRLADSRIKNGVIAYSSGNHAQAVAWSALRRGVKATIIMPLDAPTVKVNNTKALGAKLVLYDRTKEDRELIAKKLAGRTGAVIIPPYDHPDVIAGQGTVGLEAVEQLRDAGVTPDVVIVPCSGGGLIAGCAIAVKAAFPCTRILAAEPEHFDDTKRSLQAGRRVANKHGYSSVCDALLVCTPGRMTFEVMRRMVSGGEVVSETEIRAAVRAAFLYANIVVEPGGVVGLAATLSGRLTSPAETICVILSGGNIDRELFAELISN